MCSLHLKKDGQKTKFCEMLWINIRFSVLNRKITSIKIVFFKRIAVSKDCQGKFESCNCKVNITNK